MHTENWSDYYDFSTGKPVAKNKKQILLGKDSLLSIDPITKEALKYLKKFLDESKEKRGN